MADSIEIDEEREITASAGTFTLLLVPNRRRFFDQSKGIKVHGTILRPILAWASECWAYGLDAESEVFAAATDILTRKAGKYRVRLDGDPITGRELFWNSSGGKRGTIVILGQRETFDYKAIFSKCENVWTFDNFLSGHTPAAIKMAREAVSKHDLIACCLPRNNGIQWMDVYAKPKYAVQFLDAARVLVPQKPLDDE